MTSNDFTSIDVFCALDVGKSAHHGTALLRDGRTVFDKPLPNGEPQLRELFARLDRMEWPAPPRKLARVAATVGGGRAAITGGPVMFERTYAGLDVHARSVVASAMDGESGEIRTVRLVSQSDAVLAWVASLPGPVAVPSEDSSGSRRMQGPITKTGNSHARRLLIEAAWHHRRPYRVSRELMRRRDGQPAPVQDRAERGNRRLHHRWRRLDARELAGWCWSLAVMKEPS